MDKQQYKIVKTDWMVTAKKNKTVYYRWFITKKDAMKHAKSFTKKAIWKTQLFKVNYEFKQNLNTTNKRKGSK